MDFLSKIFIMQFRGVADIPNHALFRLAGPLTGWQGFADHEIGAKLAEAAVAGEKAWNFAVDLAYPAQTADLAEYDETAVNASPVGTVLTSAQAAKFTDPGISQNLSDTSLRQFASALAWWDRAKLSVSAANVATMDGYIADCQAALFAARAIADSR
jgi:hypothetical protein